MEMVVILNDEAEVHNQTDVYRILFLLKCNFRYRIIIVQIDLCLTGECK